MPKNKGQWADGGWTNTTYCKECQKYYNKKKRDKENMGLALWAIKKGYV